MADAKMIRNAKAWKRFLKIPEVISNAVGHQLAVEVDGLVQAMRRAAPVSADVEDTPGQFRDSIHSYSNPRRPLSYMIIADAKDEKGRFIGAHIEHGHKTPKGKHVEATPSFFPTYRAHRKPIRRRLNAAARKAIKAYVSNG